MTAEDVIVLIIAVLLAIYLVAALVAPEKF